jgi:hypothetical protein
MGWYKEGEREQGHCPELDSEANNRKMESWVYDIDRVSG